MSKVTIEEAESQLPALIAKLGGGECVVITRNGVPVARLIAESAPARAPRRPGSAIGRLTVAEEDESHLDDFRGYVR